LLASSTRVRNWPTSADLRVAHGGSAKLGYFGRAAHVIAAAVGRWFGEYVLTPSADPIYLYIDSVVQVIAERHLNNGQPSGHAIWITSASIKAGEHVVHIGTGTGYYTAIMACLVGPSGKVTGIELDASLAARAKEQLSSYPNVWRRHVSAVRCCRCHQRWRDPTVISWLERLTDRGRLILPMTANQGFMADDPTNATSRAVFRIERRTSQFSVQCISPVRIIPCDGARDETSETALAEAFKKGDCKRVTRLYRDNDDVPEDRCWLHGSGWCLAYD
jgi:protein-L-isoaspartate(D-aspartate) O-methyltransferase